MNKENLNSMSVEIGQARITRGVASAIQASKLYSLISCNCCHGGTVQQGKV